MTSHRTIKILIVVLLSILCSCSYSNKPIKMYDGPELAESRLSTIHKSAPHGVTLAIKLNGKSPGFNLGNISGAYHVLPGMQSITASMEQRIPITGGTLVTDSSHAIEFEAKAGKKYILEAYAKESLGGKPCLRVVERMTRKALAVSRGYCR